MQLDVARGDGVGDDVGVEGVLVSVVSDNVASARDGDGEERGVGEDVVAVGRKKVGEGDSIATAVGSGRTPAASSSLNRKPPNSMPMLNNVMARLPSAFPIPLVGSITGRVCSFTGFPLVLLTFWHRTAQSDMAGRRVGGLDGGGLGGKRKDETKSTAYVHFAFHPDTSSLRFHQCLGNR
jgi:hypothetical protein